MALFFKQYVLYLSLFSFSTDDHFWFNDKTTTLNTCGTVCWFWIIIWNEQLQFIVYFSSEIIKMSHCILYSKMTIWILVLWLVGWGFVSGGYFQSIQTFPATGNDDKNTLLFSDYLLEQPKYTFLIKVTALCTFI